MSAADYSALDLFRRSIRLLGAAGWRPAFVFLVFVALGMLVDTRIAEEDEMWLFDALLGLLAVGFQYRLMRASLRDMDGGGALPRSGFGTFFILLVVRDAAILIGLLLVVPGLILMIRWWIAAPLLLDSELTIFEALGESWRRTEGHFWPIFAVAVPPFVLAALAVLLIETTVPATTDGYTLLSALTFNVSFYAAAIFAWYASLAAYSFTEHRTHLCEAFA